MPIVQPVSGNILVQNQIDPLDEHNQLRKKKKKKKSKIQHTAPNNQDNADSWKDATTEQYDEQQWNKPDYVPKLPRRKNYEDLYMV